MAVIADQIRFQLRGSCADPKLRINRSNGYKQRRFLHFVRDAVYAVAYALRDMQVDICGEGYSGLCEQMRPVDERMFSRYLAKVSFKGGWRTRGRLAARKSCGIRKSDPCGTGAAPFQTKRGTDSASPTR